MSTLKVDAIQTSSGVPRYVIGAAWRYNQATPSVLKSLNVSSITDVSTGTYTVNFSFTNPDADYPAAGIWDAAGNGGADRSLQGRFGVKSTTSQGFYSVAANGLYDDISSGMTIGG